MKRTHYCGQLSCKLLEQRVCLCGWVRNKRLLGNLLFVDLWDRSGIAQCVSSVDENADVHNQWNSVSRESVVAVVGVIKARPIGMQNQEMPSGQVEIHVDELTVESRSAVPPFQISGKITATEELRLKYRYLDLRRPGKLQNLMLRSTVCSILRNTMQELGFVDVDTPLLTRSTPEGARDYLVPSRTNKGSYYALPQSPQLFKQILMIAGLDRYYQIARCFRDEDLRGDRQPEFTQLDMEASFVDEEDIYGILEKAVCAVVESIRGFRPHTPFPRITYREAINIYGSDKPDTRIPFAISDVTALLSQTEFLPFQHTLLTEHRIKLLILPPVSGFSRKIIEDTLTNMRCNEVPFTTWCKWDGKKFTGPFSKYMLDNDDQIIRDCSTISNGSVLLFVAGENESVCRKLGSARITFAKSYNLINNSLLEFLWVTEFPLFERDLVTESITAAHHPFTDIHPDDIALLDEHPLDTRARSYDLVLNGTELGSGSVRIHRESLQKKIFHHLGIDEETAMRKFGFLLEAFRYGAPPHAGFALGLDRFVMILAGLDSIREVIPFPKTLQGKCPLTGAPDTVDPDQLRELGIRESRADLNELPNPGHA